MRISMSVRAAVFLHQNHEGSLFQRQVPGATTAIKLSKLGPVTCTTGGTAMHVGQLVQLGNLRIGFSLPWKSGKRDFFSSWTKWRHRECLYKYIWCVKIKETSLKMESESPEGGDLVLLPFRTAYITGTRKIGIILTREDIFSHWNFISCFQEKEVPS